MFMGMVLAVSFLAGAPFTGVPPIAQAPAAPVPLSGEFESPWMDPSVALVIDPYWMNTIDWEQLATDRRVAGIIHKAPLAVPRRSERRVDRITGFTGLRGLSWGSSECLRSNPRESC